MWSIIALRDIVDLIGWSIDLTLDSAVSSGSTCEILEDRSADILIALETGVKFPIYDVGHFGEGSVDADISAVVSGINSVVVPDLGAGVGEPEVQEALHVDIFSENSFDPAPSDRRCEVHRQIDGEVLKSGAGPAPPLVRYDVAVDLALLGRGEFFDHIVFFRSVYVSDSADDLLVCEYWSDLGHRLSCLVLVGVVFVDGIVGHIRFLSERLRCLLPCTVPGHLGISLLFRRDIESQK